MGVDAPHAYDFQRVAPADLRRIAAWQALPHVREWWGDDDPLDATDLADTRVARWIVSLHQKPFAFMQDYDVHGWEEHHLDVLPARSRGIDQFVGEADMLGIGHGSSFIAQRMRALFDTGVPVIGTDPHPDNARAIRTYEKLGFTRLGPPMETKWGLILPMAAHP